MTTHAMVGRFSQARGDPSLALLEGFHPLKHAIRFGAELLEVASVDVEKVRQMAAELAPDILNRLEEHLVEVPARIFGQMAPLPPATGVIAIARRPTLSLEGMLASPAPNPVVFLEEPSNLGNMGAVIRVAAAAGAGGVITSGIHDPWQPSALRGSAGLHFSIPVLQTRSLPDCDRPLVAVHPDGEPLQTSMLPERAILAFGSERRGLSRELLSKADSHIAIAMREGVSSLNLATAVAVVLYA
jgi:TrmH family RNA methyltransferase